MSAVALDEGAAHAVLARQAHRDSPRRAGCRRPGARPVRPVDALARLDRLAAVLDHPARRVLWTFSRSGMAVSFRPMSRSFCSGTAVSPRRSSPSGRARPRPLAVQPVGLVGVIGLAGLELLVEEGVELGDPAVDLAWVTTPSLDQALAVELARRRVVLDVRVHQGLGHGRVVALVVAEAAIAEHVDDHVLAELLAVLGGDLGGEDHRFRVVAVGVEDRRLDHQRRVRRIGAGARIARAGGEADLVVDDEVQRCRRCGSPSAPSGRSTRR